MARVFRFDEFELDETQLQLRLAGMRVELRPKALSLLVHLLRNRDRLVGREELLREVWPGTTVSESSLGSLLHDLRRALGDTGTVPRYIGTLRGRGYRFLAPLDAAPATATTPPAQAQAQAQAPIRSRRSETRTPFIDREIEMARLGACLATAASGQGRLVLVHGPPGIGKTRTVFELARQACERGFDIHVGKGHQGEGAPPLWFWIEILRSMLETRGVAKLEEAAGSTLGELTRLLPELGIADSPPSHTASLSAQRRFVLFDALTRLLERLAQSCPVMLVLDDLHEADEGSLALLRFLAGRLSEVPLLVAATYRELPPGSTRERLLYQTLREPGAESMTLAGMTRASVERILERLMGAPIGPGLLERVYGTTGGNPFFVSEIAHLLVDQGIAPKSAPASLPIPESLRDAVRGRTAGLSPGCRDVLNLAAVAGNRIHLSLLRRASELSSTDLMEALDEAHRQDLLRSAESGEHEFVHGVVRETLYEALPAAKRALMHRDIGDALESLSAGRLVPPLAELAHHFGEAMELDRGRAALHYARRAAEQARSVFVPGEATQHLRRALAALDFCDSTDPDLRCELTLALADALVAADAPLAEVESVCEHAARLARGCQRWDLLARSSRCEAQYMWQKDSVFLLDPTRIALRCAAIGARLDEALERLGSSERELRVDLLLVRGTFLDVQGSHARAQSLLDEAVALAETCTDASLRARATMVRCDSHPVMNRTPERIAAYRAVGEVARESSDLTAELFAHLAHAALELTRNDRAAAERAFERVLDLAADPRIPSARPQMCLWRSLMAQLDGRFVDAERWSSAAAQSGAALNYSPEQWGGPFATQFWWLRMVQGQAKLVLDAARTYAALHPGMPFARLMLGRLYIELDRFDDARKELEQIQLERLAQDDSWLMANTLAADICLEIGDSRRADALLEALEPYADRHAAVWIVTTTGAVARQVGRLCAMQQRWHDAETYFERASALNRAVDSPVFVAWTQLEHALALSARGRRGDAVRARELRAAAASTAGALGMHALSARARALR